MIKIAFREEYILPLDKKHRFPMDKYELIPQQLMHEGTLHYSEIQDPELCSIQDIARTHDMDFIKRAQDQTLSKKEVRNLGFPQSKELFERELYITQGSIDMALFALENTAIGLNVAGGTHHAFKDKGEGFCLFNDFAVTANHLLDHELAAKILIIDLDVHQGNGTASIFKNEPRVFTFSMHGGKNYPFHKESSDLDLPLKDGINGIEYHEILDKYLNKILDDNNPDIVFYLSGVDVLSTDKLGKLSLSKESCALRDRKVIEACFHRNLPMLVAMGGGYSPEIIDIVDAHCNTFRIAKEIYD